MKGQTIAALIIVGVACVATGAFYLLKPLLAARDHMRASDAGQTEVTTIRIGGDGYAGYGVFRSGAFIQNALGRGIAVDFKDDGGAYAERLRSFTAGELDMMVLPVNSYLEHGKGWPGVIVAAIAESKGADAIVGRRDKFATMNVKALDDPSLRIGFTPGSPSEFLLNSVRSHFGLESLGRGASMWRVETNGSEDVRKRLLANQLDIGILWEPDVSKTLENPEMVVILGSDQVRGLIVDVLVVRRDFLLNQEETVARLMETYFMSLRQYSLDRPRFIADMATVSGMSPRATEGMLGKIDFIDLQENATRFFGIYQGSGRPVDGIMNVIFSCSEVLKGAQVALASELKNPYEITNRGFVERLATTMPFQGDGNTTPFDFPPLDASAWKGLTEVGALRLEQISFIAGSDIPDQASKERIDSVAILLRDNYPDTRVVVRGHTGPGDEKENRQLSQSRADAVRQYLSVTHAIDPDRMLAEGVGASQPPKPVPGESQRSLRLRSPRVEFVLLKGDDI